jgi:hypothetical protein
MIDATMSQDSPLEIVLPTEFTQEHHDALLVYLVEARFLDTAVWRPFYFSIENNELLAQDGVLYYQVFATTDDVRYSASGENCGFWFGEFLDGVFDLMKERFAGVDDSRKHDAVSILVGGYRVGVITKTVENDMVWPGGNLWMS